MNENLKSSSVHILVSFIKGLYIYDNLSLCFFIQSIPFVTVFFTHGILGYCLVYAKRTTKSPKTFDLRTTGGGTSLTASGRAFHCLPLPPKNICFSVHKTNVFIN